jgi:ABC-type sugar transport system permease subunit
MKSNGIRKYTVTWPLFFTAPFVVFFFLFNLFPILYSFFLSLHNWAGYGARTFVGFGNYLRIFTQDKVFWKSIWNTAYIGVISFPVSIALGLMLAALLSQLKKFRQLFQVVNFLPYITTPVAIGLIFIFIFDWNTGIVNRLVELLGGTAVNWTGSATFAPLVIAIMIVWKTAGYYMAMYLAGITSISEDVYEAARVDGATAAQTFFRITLPLLKPVTTFLAITSAIYALQLFDEPNLLFNVTTTAVIGGPGRSCLTAVWNFYDTAFGSNARLGYASAMSTILFLIIVLVSVMGLRLMNRKEGSAQ